MAGEQSNSDEKAAKKARKAALKKEADTLGISYEELKKQKKERKKKREADQLQDGEHQTELKRMRTWSKDYDEDPSVKKRRTRSMDKAEEEQEQESISPEAWRREHGIKVQGHGAHQSAVDFADPFLKFTDTPYCPAIIKAFQQAGFDAPTHIQSQVRLVYLYVYSIVRSRFTYTMLFTILYMSGLADCYQGTRHDLHCKDWVGQDAWILASRLASTLGKSTVN